jgi:hypothetical protein
MINQSKLFVAAAMLFLGTLAHAQTTTSTAAVSPERLKAAQGLLTATDVGNQMTAMYNNIIETSSAQIPEDKKVKFKEVMRTFLNKYMSYASLEPELVKIYAEEFTEQELKDITKFYLTPAGKKMAQKLSVLQQKGMAIGQQRVQAHMAELQESMKAAFAN